MTFEYIITCIVFFGVIVMVAVFLPSQFPLWAGKLISVAILLALAISYVRHREKNKRDQIKDIDQEKVN